MAQIEKLPLTSLDIKAHQLERLKEIFPEAFTEGSQVDWEKLRLTLGVAVDTGKERYGMNWPGKGDCFKTIQQPSIATLVPAREESVDFDTTQNLFIEGDNLEVLKLLQKSYLGKVKMVYIDPPYNTGNDFIYPDNYSENLDTYLAYTGQVDSEGKKFSTNTETDGRFHSKWMNMMYPRLFLAKNILREDGVIFISIGDEELANLRAVANEIFGEENFISTLPRIMKTTSFKGNFFAPSVDYILCYAKNILTLPSFSEEIDVSQFPKIEVFGDRKGEKYRDDLAFYLSTLDITRGSYNQRYFIDCPDGSKVLPPGKTFPPEKGKPGDGVWRWGYEGYLKNKHLLVFKETSRSPLLDENGNQAKYNIYTKSYLNDRLEKGKIPRNYLDNFLNREGTEELNRLDIPFDYSKPNSLIKHLIDIVNPKNGDIVLDFFAGSGTTAQSSLELFSEKGLSIKFILVQLPEPVDEETKAYEKGFRTVSDISKERLRRVIQKIKQEQKENKNLFTEGSVSQDLGFKVFKLQKSNFNIWDAGVEKTPEAIQQQLFSHVDHISPEAEQEAILYELLLKSGFEVTTIIEQLTIEGKKVFSIAEGELLICLEKQLTHEAIKAIAELKPTRVICLDEGFQDNDQLKTNAVQMMKSKGVVNFRTV
jgi:adenine-specific DNA-methyltransferase